MSPIGIVNIVLFGFYLLYLVQQASKEIFRSRNSMATLNKGQIDIHGLHVAEMIACMEEMLPYFNSTSYHTLRVITGSGHHTDGPQKGASRLLPALIEYCEDMGIQYSPILDPNGIKCGLVLKLQ